MVEYNKKETGQKIKNLRIENNLSQQEFADKLGIAQNTVAQYESGLANPSLKILVKIAVLYNTSTDYLLGVKKDDE